MRAFRLIVDQRLRLHSVSRTSKCESHAGGIELLGVLMENLNGLCGVMAFQWYFMNDFIITQALIVASPRKPSPARRLCPRPA